MELTIRPASIMDAEFVFESNVELLSENLYSFSQFKDYWVQLCDGKIGSCDSWICKSFETSCGYAIVSRIPVPRYIGFVIEIEEIVISKSFQNKGVGTLFISSMIEYYQKDINCRKVIIKTDDHDGSGKLYSRIFKETAMKTYQLFLNKI